MTSIKRLLLLFIIILFCPTVFATVGLTPIEGTPSCGAIQDGQDLCGTGPATFESNAIGECPAGTFPDLGRWGCYSCPEGFDRGIAAVDSDRACTRVKTTDLLDRFVSAKQVGSACPAGSFFDPVRGGECFSCPSGFERSIAHIDWPDACVIYPKEVFSKATEHGSGSGILGTDCGRELILTDEPPFVAIGPVQFWDGIDGNCHSCPTDYIRTGFSVHDSRACSKVISGSQKYATIEGQAQCLDGEIADFLTNPEQGGNCYTCPTGYDRTLFSVNGSSACETTPEIEFSAATKTDDLTCPANQIFDLISTNHPHVKTKLLADGVSSDLYDNNDLGTCWTCPPGAVRSWSSVTESDACVLAELGWNMPTYQHVGLFGLKSASEVIVDIINEKNDINELAKGYAQSSATLTVNEFTDDVWQEISQNPEESSLLALVAFARLQDFSTRNDLAPHEREFLEDFQKQVTDYRSAMAQEALNILEVWQDGAFLRYIDPRFNNRPEIVAQKLFWASIGVLSPPVSPPDFSALIYEFEDTPEVDPLVLALTAAERSIDQGILTTLMPKNVFSEISSEITGIIKDKALSAIQDEIIDKIEKQILLKAQSAGAKVSTKMLLFGPPTLGPQIAIALFIEYATQWVDFIAGSTDAEPKLLAALAQAQQLYNVSRQLETSPGREDLLFNYKTIMNSSVVPSAADKLKIEQAVTANNTYPITFFASLGGSVDTTNLEIIHGGTSSIVNAIPKNTYKFINWTDSTGAEISNDPALTITNVTASETYTANFSIATYTINTTLEPALAGSVSCSPNPVNSGENSSCVESTQSGYLFTHFSGDCSGTICNITEITTDKNVVANYELIIINESVNGSCGSSHGNNLATAPDNNLCSTGTASTIEGTGPWNWSCNGLNGGENSSCSALLFGSDSPVISVPESIVVAATDQNGTAASDSTISSFLNSASANDGAGTALVTAHDAPEIFPLGLTVVTFSASDSSGTTISAQANVTISDKTAPIVIAPMSIAINAAEQNSINASNSTITEFLTAATANDNVDGVITTTHNAPTIFPLGLTIVTFSAVDKSGNTGSAQANVTIGNTTLLIAAPESITVAATDQNGTAASDSTISSFLNSASVSNNTNIVIVPIHDAPATFPLGLTVVTFSATDNTGANVSAQASVTVIDTPPTVTAPSDIIINASAILTPVLLGVATAIDTVDGVLPAVTDQAGPFTSGIHSIIWSATDSSGNKAETTQTLRVRPLANFAFDQKADNKGGVEVEIGLFLNGTAADYPVTIPFTVTGTANNPVDHDLTSGSIVINNGNSGNITFNLVNNSANVDNKTIILTMGTPINAAKGTRPTHTITLSENNEVPRVTLTLDQNGVATNSIAITGNGNIVATASVVDPNKLDSHTYDWVNTNNKLIDLDTIDKSFTFDPTTLSSGVYQIAVSVMDNATPPLFSSDIINVLVQSTEPALSASEDSDNDGANDANEGYGDVDKDGVPDYLDAIPELNVLSGESGNSNTFLMETNPGLHLRLGSIAIGNANGSARVNSADIELQSKIPADTITNIGGLFDFEISQLPTTGQSITLVMAQITPVPENPIYRKLINGGWSNFIENGTDSLASTLGAEGYCPPPGDSSYTNGLTPGHWCVQVTIMDGGSNDADGEANNRVIDPGGVGMSQPIIVIEDDNNQKSGSGAISWWELILLSTLVLTMFRKKKQPIQSH